MNNQSKRSVIQTALINFGLGCALEILPEGCTVDQEETLIWLIHIVSINRSILTTDDIEKMVRLIVDKGHTKIQIRTNHPDLDYHNKTLEWLNRIVLANSAILTPRDIENMVLLAETGRTKEQIRSNYPGLNYNQKTLTWLEGIILENRSILTQYDIENYVEKDNSCCFGEKSSTIISSRV